LVSRGDQQVDVVVGEEESDVAEETNGGEAEKVLGLQAVDALDGAVDHPADQSGEGTYF
jgi:hypothetical protein